MAGADIAKEVFEGLVEAQGETGPAVSAILNAPVEQTNPWDTPIGTPTTSPATVIFSQFKGDQIDGSSVLATDVRILMAAEGIKPVANKHTLTIDGKDHVIVNADSISPAGVDVLYILQCRV